MLETRRVADRETLYEKYVNPQWARLLDVRQMNLEYTHCVGSELHTTDGRQILDFISGYCVHNVGHNHPRGELHCGETLVPVGRSLARQGLATT